MTDDTAKSKAQKDTSASVKFFITRSEQARLRKLGYSEERIAKMKPEEAQVILQYQLAREPYDLGYAAGLEAANNYLKIIDAFIPQSTPEPAPSVSPPRTRRKLIIDDDDD